LVLKGENLANVVVVGIHDLHQRGISHNRFRIPNRSPSRPKAFEKKVEAPIKNPRIDSKENVSQPAGTETSRTLKKDHRW
jgi:hypothetical protein